MTAQDDNLRVLTEHIRWLSGKQQAAAGRITIANQAPAGVAAGMWGTHGAACAATNMAMAAAETARTAAGTNMLALTHDLAERLTDAATNYEDADYRAGIEIGSCGI